MVKPIIVVGAGGHCRVVLSILAYYKEFRVVGIADRNLDYKGEKICGSIIQYSWHDFIKLYQRNIRHAVIAVGNNKERKDLYSRLKKIGFKIPSIVHPTALIEKNATLKDGNIVCMGAKIGSMVSIGSNCIVYTGSILDHESIIQNNVFIAPACAIAGRVKVKKNAYVGIGTTIKEKIIIGSNAIIGAGSVVIRDVSDNTVVMGSPAKEAAVKQNNNIV